MNIFQMYQQWKLNRQLSQEYEETWMPEWAIGLTDGLYTDIHAQLPTKDGWRTGNAVSLGTEEKKGILYIKIVTDAGNILFLTQNEVEELFHPPRYIMASLLPAHKQAIMDEKKDPNFRGIPDYKIGVMDNTGTSYTFAFHTHEEREAFGYGVKIAMQMTGGTSSDSPMNEDQSKKFEAKATNYKKQMN